MKIPLNFPFSILIVEDQDNWYEPMRLALKKLLPHAKIEIATNISEAKDKLRETHFHFASLDQNMPESSKSEVSVDIGSGFTVDLQKRHPCLGLAIYTGYFFSTEGGKIGQVAGRNIPIWEKAIGPDGETSISVATWAKKVTDWLSHHYIDFYFKLASTHLPCNLAERSGHLVNLLTEQDANNAQTIVKHSFYFWNLILQIATAQSMAIAREFKINFQAAENSKLETQERLLENISSLLESQNKILFWTPYIGHSAGRFLDHSRAIRNYRNKDSHQVPLDDYRPLLTKITPHLLAIMDASCFWTDYPLLTHLNSQSDGTFKADIIKDSRYPWNNCSFDWQTDTQPNPDHVYLRYSDPYSDQIKLLNLWPFITKEFNQSINRPILTLFSHRWKNNWYRVSLITGTPEIWYPSQDEINILSKYY